MDDVQHDYLKWKNKRIKNKKKGGKTSSREKKSKLLRQEELEDVELLQNEYDEFDSNKAETFEEFPLSEKTKIALEESGFLKPTAIQKAAILPALKGSDVLGAAKTGSGKTLAFLVPILECLYRNQWNSMDGPGALVISPTRELALQTFEVLCKVGRKHDFSAGLVIGGKDVQEEAERVCRTNIVVCTPGRLLQHLDSTSYFSLGNLKILVLDEADRILDLGFSETVNAILENLPAVRQTLLFSATQTRSIKDLARLSLTDPVYISVHAESKHSTPKGLVQRYVVCPLEDKINLLYSFIRNHLKTKTLVFVSSCKQVQYLFAAFCQLRPGVPIMHLHGNMHLARRLGNYREFCRKKFALLFATDIAARGLDFPDINWVIQLDCPEDAETYIHRVGRTARYFGNGNALMVILPSELGIVDELNKKKVPIEKSQVNVKKLTQVNERLESFCAKEQELCDQAKRCFVAYFKSVHLMKNKSIFKVKELPVHEFARSLGLAFPPRIRFLQRLEKKKALKLKKLKELEGGEETISIPPLDDDADQNFLSVKRVTEKQLEGMIAPETESKSEITTGKEKNKLKRALRKKEKVTTAILRRGRQFNEKLIFDDAGEPVIEEEDDKGDESGINLQEAKERMKKRDAADRKEHKRKMKEKKLARKKKAKEEEKMKHGGRFDVELAIGDNGNDSDVIEASLSDDRNKPEVVPRKRKKKAAAEDIMDTSKEDVDFHHSDALTLQEQEDLVLRLLGK